MTDDKDGIDWDAFLNANDKQSSGHSTDESMVTSTKESLNLVGLERFSKHPTDDDKKNK